MFFFASLAVGGIYDVGLHAIGGIDEGLHAVGGIDDVGLHSVGGIGLQRLERLIVNSDAAQGFRLFKNKTLESCRRHIPRNTLLSITHHGSTMMSSSPSQDVREPMIKERGTTLTKPVLNTSLLDGWLKEQQRSKPNATRKSMLQDYAKLTLKASTPT